VNSLCFWGKYSDVDPDCWLQPRGPGPGAKPNRRQNGQVSLKYDKQKKPDNRRSQANVTQQWMAKEVTNVTEVAQLILLITAVSTICVSKWDQ
jgi:hypothetical protein